MPHHERWCKIGGCSLGMAAQKPRQTSDPSLIPFRSRAAVDRRRRYIAVTTPENPDACSETSEQWLPIDAFDLEAPVSR